MANLNSTGTRIIHLPAAEVFGLSRCEIMLQEAFNTVHMEKSSG
jgi:hypothetical protein